MIPFYATFFWKLCYNRDMEPAILKFFEGIRCVPLDWIFGIFSFLGEGLTVGVIVLLLFWLLPRRTGEQLLVTAVSSAAVNAFLKNAISRPRPYAAGVVSRRDVDTPLFSTRDLGDTLSCPSGHAQATSSALCAGAMLRKKIYGWVLFGVLIALVCCSRMYFGVHYPTDVLLGTALGVLIAVLWHLVYRYAYKARYFCLMGLAAALLLTLPFYPEHDHVQMTALLSGAAFFLPLCSFLKYKETDVLWKRLLHIPLGGLAAGAMFGVALLFPEGLGFTLLKWFLLFGAGTFGATALFKLCRV